MSGGRVSHRNEVLVDESFTNDDGSDEDSILDESREIRSNIYFLSYMNKKDDEAEVIDGSNTQNRRTHRAARIITTILAAAVVAIGLGLSSIKIMSKEQLDEKEQGIVDLRQTLLRISPGKALFDTSSNQYKALEWLVDHGPIDSMLEETYLMALLYYSAGGSKWKHKGLFLQTSYPVCDWNDDLDEEGIFCDDSRSNIIYVRLRDMRVEGTLPSELFHLTSLQMLHLEDNRISGSIPSEFGNFSNMYHFDVHNNQVTGTLPTELGNIGANMMNGGTLYFNVFGNQISGTIPTEYGNLPARTMDLSENPLRGTIPTELGKIYTMSDLDLAQNSLTGPIPTEIGSLTNLVFLRLEKNQLSSTIPTEFGQLSLLKILRLDKNYLQGTFPSQLNKLSSLTRFNSHRNNVTGSLDPIFCKPGDVGNVYIPFVNAKFENLTMIRADTFCIGEIQNSPKVACACCCCICAAVQ